MGVVRVVVIGANGYGISHRKVVARLQEAGQVELVGLCDLASIEDVPDAPVPPATVVATDFRELLAVTEPDIAIIATPPHTHMAIGALAALVQAIGSGRLGTVVSIGAWGAWRRPDAYYERAPWAGRREHDGRPVLDAALANPFAHALMQTLAVAAAVGDSAVQRIELERYRARPIEVDDTGAVRLRLASGIDVVVAVTLCADEVIDPILHVRGTHGTADLEYTTDRLRLPGEHEPRPYQGRVNLLENLLAQRASVDVPLLARLAMTAPFTTVIDHIAGAPLPTVIQERFIHTEGTGSDRIVTVPGSPHSCGKRRGDWRCRPRSGRHGHRQKGRRLQRECKNPEFDPD